MVRRLLVKDHITIKQNGITMYLLKINIEELLEHTFVELYDHTTGEGYQRKLVPEHYRKIAKFLNESSSPIIPSSIICAIDIENIEIADTKIIFKDKLRIVDGQHRREGFRYFIQKYSDQAHKFDDYEIPMIVLVVENFNDKIVEIETFVNINSKGKPVKTDLAVELREKLREDEDFVFSNKNDFIESIAISVSKICNEQPNQPWFEKIRFAEEQARKPVGLNTFKKSLEPIVKSFIDYYSINFEEIHKLSPRYDKVVLRISSLYIECWSIVFRKWEDAFYNYNEYNIMKSIGIYSINYMIAQCISRDGKQALEEFNEFIVQSKASSSIWRRGGELSGMSSSQGFKQVAERITDNEVKYISYIINNSDR